MMEMILKMIMIICGVMFTGFTVDVVGDNININGTEQDGTQYSETINVGVFEDFTGGIEERVKFEVNAVIDYTIDIITLNENPTLVEGSLMAEAHYLVVSNQ